MLGWFDAVLLGLWKYLGFGNISPWSSAGPQAASPCCAAGDAVECPDYRVSSGRKSTEDFQIPN